MGMLDYCTCHNGKGSNRDECEVHRSGATKIRYSGRANTRGFCIIPSRMGDSVTVPGVGTVSLPNAYVDFLDRNAR